MHHTRYNTEITLTDNFTLDEAAQEAADIIMTEYEPVLIERCIKARYSFLTRDEQKEIAKLAKKLSKEEKADEFPPFSARRQTMYDEIKSYLCTEGNIVPCGFVDFRMRKPYYWAEAIVSKGADMFFDKKEYEEFTYLLSVFVAEKEPREEVIHLIKKHGRVKLFNKRGRDVTEKYEKEFLAAAKEKNVSDEDLAISAIISAAPKKLVIHFSEAIPLCETLKHIFGDRCTVCKGCKVCEKC